MSQFNRHLWLDVDLGLSCSADGVTLASAPLLRRTRHGWAPRSREELSAILAKAYESEPDPTQVEAGLNAVAQALNEDNLERAEVAAHQLGLPDLSLSRADFLFKALGPIAKLDIDAIDAWLEQWVANVMASMPPTQAALEPPWGSEAERAQALKAIRTKLRREFNRSSARWAAKHIIEYSDGLETQACSGHPLEMTEARTRYALLQDYLNFWIGHPDTMFGDYLHLLSAAKRLFQAAIHSGLVDAVPAPQSMVEAAAAALAYGETPVYLPPRITRSPAGYAPPPPEPLTSAELYGEGARYCPIRQEIIPISTQVRESALHQILQHMWRIVRNAYRNMRDSTNLRRRD